MTPLKILVILDEFARIGRAQVIASAFSYVAGYGIRLLPVIPSRSQLRAVYGEHVANEIVANCGVESSFTPTELPLANDLSDRIGYIRQVSRSVWWCVGKDFFIPFCFWLFPSYYNNK